MYNLLFLVDGISSICADRFLMDEWHVDVAILSSQKALALPPGLSFVALNERASSKMGSAPIKSLYFNLADYLENQQRGQVPYTPAIGLFLMLHKRLKEVQTIGLETIIGNHAKLAGCFRTSITKLPISVLPECPSK